MAPLPHPPRRPPQGDQERGLQPAGPSALEPRPRTVPPPHRRTVPPPHRPTAAPPHRPTAAPPHRPTAAPPDRPTAPLLPLLALLLLATPCSALAGGAVTNSALASLYSALLGGGQVTFNASTSLTFQLIAPLEILSDTTLDARTNTATITLSGANRTRLFNVHPGVTLTLINLTLTNGLSSLGGAIHNQGTLIATNCLFQNHTASGTHGAAGDPGGPDFSLGGRGGNGGDGDLAQGGAIYSQGHLHLVRCRFLGNRAEGGDGGNGGAGGDGGLQGGRGGDGGAAGFAQGGAVFSSGTLHAQDCTFSSNAAEGGSGGSGGAAGAGGYPDAVAMPGHSRPGHFAAGGALFLAGQATLTACTFHTNTVRGGQATNEFTDPTGWGRPGRAGGSASGGAVANEGTLTLTNCTFAANAAAGGQGGNGGDGSAFRGGSGGDGGDALGGTLWSRGHTLAVHCTFVSGHATGGTGGTPGKDSWDLDPVDPRPGRPGTDGGGNLARTEGSLELLNCLVAHALSGGNGYGGTTDLGHNLSSDHTLGFHAPGSLSDTDPQLGELGNYGGPTQTIPLHTGSPAIDAAQTLDSPATDQRGIARPQGIASDIGAFERAAASLSGWVRRADASPYPGVTITLYTATILPRTTTTDSQGYYHFNVLPDTDLGVYRLVPSAGTVVFDPAYRDRTLTSPTESITDLNFTADQGQILSFGLHPDGHFHFRFRGSPLDTVLIQATSPTHAWLTIGQATTDTAGLLDFTDPTPPLSLLRFYRVVSAPP